MSKSTIASKIILVAAALLAASCSTTRSLGDGELRLAKNVVEITNDDTFRPKELESYIKQKSNTYVFFGWNPFLNIYNWSGQDDTKAINKFWRKMGVAPVVYSPELVNSSVEDMARHLEYLGYYGSSVESLVKQQDQLAEVTYKVTLGKRFKIGKITYEVPEGDFKRDFYADTANITVKKGSFLSEDALEKESQRSAAYFRKNGYFGFTKNYYFFEADTLFSKDTANLVMAVKEYTRNQTPESAKPLTRYNFGDVSISYDKDLAFKKKVLMDINTIKPGNEYSEVDVNNTYSRFSALKIFNGVNIELTPDDSSHVDCNIKLSKSKTQGFKVNLETSTNSSGLIGVSPQVNYFHKNIFHGGEWLNLGFLGNFQYKSSDRDVRSIEFGVSGSISFPGFLGLPNSLFTGPNVPRSEVNLSYSYQNRPEYNRNMFSTSFGYTGSLMDRHFFYQAYPIQAKIVNMKNMDEEFYKNLVKNPFLRDAYQNHFDVGSGFIGYYTTTKEMNPKSDFSYIRFQFDASGNVISLFNKYLKQDEFGNRTIWDMPYSQYVRTEVTFSKTFFLGTEGNRSIATRFLAGLGYGYGNSSSLPFEKQFYCGGSNSMRGWQARALGPGRAKMDSLFVIPSQTGNVKLEANVEYRFPMFWKLQGALFTDVGNVWNLKSSYSEEDNPSVLRLNTFAESLAADWGLGLRVDMSFLILRIDLGVKLYDPSLDTDRWFGPLSWLDKDTYAIHFGVGYPF